MSESIPKRFKLVCPFNGNHRFSNTKEFKSHVFGEFGCPDRGGKALYHCKDKMHCSNSYSEHFFCDLDKLIEHEKIECPIQPELDCDKKSKMKNES